MPKEQCRIIEEWTDAITARNAAYSAVVFRMGIQCCFSNVEKTFADAISRCKVTATKIGEVV